LLESCSRKAAGLVLWFMETSQESFVVWADKDLGLYLDAGCNFVAIRNQHTTGCAQTM